MMVDQWLHTHAITHQVEAFLFFVPHGKRKHTFQFLNRIDAPGGEGSHQHFGIAGGLEGVIPELLFDFGVIVNLAVEDQDIPSRWVMKGLVGGIAQVDD